jgi:hypothetical protein
MKLRHKQSGVEIEGTIVPSCHMWCGDGGSRYSDLEWEVVQPEPVWRDVTHECEPWGEDSYLMTHKGFAMGPNHRVRKSTIKEQYGEGAGPTQAVFIVEKKEQP